MLKTLLTISLSLLSTFCFAQSETVLTDLNSDGKIDTVKLDIKTGKTITFSLNEGGARSFINKEDSWNKIDTSFSSKNKNSVNSDYIFIYKQRDQTIILLFGEVGGAGYNRLSAFQVRKNGVNRVFDEMLEWTISISDIDKDGNPDILGSNMGEMYDYIDSLKADVGTYNPYLVYTIYNDRSELNKTLTKNYNQEHYVFAGYEYNDKIKVLYPRHGGKPRIIK